MYVPIFAEANKEVLRAVTEAKEWALEPQKN